MNGLTLLNRRRWSPFNEVDALNNQLSHLLFGDNAHVGGAEETETRGWVPLVDVVEAVDAYVIKAELPEVDRKDITVKVEDGVLTIAGERKAEETSEENRVHRTERSYGKFVRTFRVPKNADVSKVGAEYKDGVLRVSVPKVAEAKPKSIDITVA